MTNKTETNKKQTNKNLSSNTSTFIYYLDQQYKNNIERKKEKELLNRIYKNVYNNPYPKISPSDGYYTELDFDLLF
jgi:hypothetical protein